MVHTCQEQHPVRGQHHVSIVRPRPFAVTASQGGHCPGLRSFEIQMGYMEIPRGEYCARRTSRRRHIYAGDITATNICWQPSLP